MERLSLFIDTNVIIEYLEKRSQFDSVKILMNMLEDKEHDGFISVGSFYTIAYILEQGLKRKGIESQSRLDLTRRFLSAICQMLSISDIDNSSLLNGVKDESFADIEDSLQHQAAVSAKCDYIITLNIKDFKESTIPVMSPKQFVDMCFEGQK